MRLRSLQMFCEVARLGSFTAAAQASNATQSTVSKAIRQLEDDLGAALIDRQRHPPGLTTAGEAVLPHARDMLAAQQQMREELDRLQGLQRGVLRLGLPPLGSASLFAPLFAIYRQRHPLIDIQLVEHGSRRLEELLLAGEIELAATLLPTPGELDAQAVYQDRLAAVLPADHPLAARREVHLRELAQTPFILYESGFALNGQLRQACARQGFEPQVSARSSQPDFIISLVAAGQGVAFMPQLMVSQHRHQQVRFILLHKEAGTLWHIALAWPRNRTLSAAALKWLELTRQNIGAAAPPPPA